LINMLDYNVYCATENIEATEPAEQNFLCELCELCG
jgi:hypothetical protein